MVTRFWSSLLAAEIFKYPNRAITESYNACQRAVTEARFKITKIDTSPTSKIHFRWISQRLGGRAISIYVAHSKKTIFHAATKTKMSQKPPMRLFCRNDCRNPSYGLYMSRQKGPPPEPFFDCRKCGQIITGADHFQHRKRLHKAKCTFKNRQSRQGGMHHTHLITLNIFKIGANNFQLLIVMYVALR